MTNLKIQGTKSKIALEILEVGVGEIIHKGNMVPIPCQAKNKIPITKQDIQFQNRKHFRWESAATVIQRSRVRVPVQSKFSLPFSEIDNISLIVQCSGFCLREKSCYDQND